MVHEPEGTRRKVLILDDEPHVVTYLEMLLQDNGYDTMSAPNGKIGMRMAKSDKPDLICLDITMPEQSGIAFYRELKGDPELGRTPVIVVTAVTPEDDDPVTPERIISSRNGMPRPEGFFSKPIDREEFLAAVSRVLSPEQ